MASWRDEQKLVQYQFDTLNQNQAEAARKIQALEIDMAIIKTKAALIGGFAGAAVPGIIQIAIYISKHV